MNLCFTVRISAAAPGGSVFTYNHERLNLGSIHLLVLRMSLFLLSKELMVRIAFHCSPSLLSDRLSELNNDSDPCALRWVKCTVVHSTIFNFT